MDVNSGLVLCKTKGFYRVLSHDGETYDCKAKGTFFKNSRYDQQIVAGDRVEWITTPTSLIIIRREERQSEFYRQRININAKQVVAANAHTLCLVLALKAPLFRLNLALRMITAARIGRLQPVVILTKCDLGNKKEIEDICELFSLLDITCLPYSLYQKGSEKNVLPIINENISIFAGQSGVGKSSLINRIIPSLNLRVNEVSSKNSKGKHTTSITEIYFADKHTLLIDTPGIREFNFFDITAQELDQYFPGFAPFLGKCKYRNCAHIGEDKCAIEAEMAKYAKSKKVWEEYVKIYETLTKPF